MLNIFKLLSAPILLLALFLTPIPDSTVAKTVGMSTEKLETFMNSWWWTVICFIVGCGGICMYILRRAIVTRGDTKGAFKLYFDDHRNTIFLSFGSYLIMMLVWFFNGLTMFGLEQFKLSLMSYFIGYNSQDMFDAYNAQKFNAGKPPIVDNGGGGKSLVNPGDGSTTMDNTQNQL